MTLPAIFEGADLAPGNLQAIQRLAGELAKLPQAEPAMDHTFVPGLYVRSCIVPAGHCYVGRRHRAAHVIFVDGDISVFDPHDGLQRITGCRMLEATPGVQRAVFAHADTIFRNVHPNPDDCRDLAQLQARLIFPDEEVPA